MKKLFAVLSLLFFSFVYAVPAYSDHTAAHSSKDGCCNMSNCDRGGMRGQKDDYDCPITSKFMKKARFILSNKTEIGLSDEQVNTIEGLKLEVEKTAVRQGADMQIMMLDVMSKLHEDKVDVQAVNTMVDKGSASMTDGAKSIVAAYAKLKETLSAQQLSKMKEIWKAKKE